MAKVKRVKGRGKGKLSAVNRIEEMKSRYGDAVTIIQHTYRKPGSPACWRPDYARMIFWLALSGMTEVEMSNVVGIAVQTLQLWKKTHPVFLEAMEKGRAEAIGMASEALFKAGLGFEHPAEKLFAVRVKHYDPVTGRVVKEDTEIKRATYTKKYPPNVTALDKFLKARYPEVWGDKSEVHHSGTVNHNVDVQKLSKKQLKMLKKLGKSAEKQEKTDIK